jgi:hypothetical protein
MSKKGSYFIGIVVVLVLIGLISFPATGVAAGSDLANRQGCSLIGGWFGYNVAGDMAEWIVIAQGATNSSGTITLADKYFDATLGGTFPAVGGTDLYGTWERTNGNTFRFAMIGYAVNADHVTLYIAKMSGTITIMDDCNKGYLDLRMDYFASDANPFVDEPFYGFPLPNHDGYRMRID